VPHEHCQNVPKHVPQQVPRLLCVDIPREVPRQASFVLFSIDGTFSKCFKS